IVFVYVVTISSTFSVGMPSKSSTSVNSSFTSAIKASTLYDSSSIVCKVSFISAISSMTMLSCSLSSSNSSCTPTSDCSISSNSNFNSVICSSTSVILSSNVSNGASLISISSNVSFTSCTIPWTFSSSALIVGDTSSNFSSASFKTSMIPFICSNPSLVIDSASGTLSNAFSIISSASCASLSVLVKTSCMSGNDSSKLKIYSLNFSISGYSSSNSKPS